MTVVDREKAIAALDEQWNALLPLAADPASDDWARPTACPARRVGAVRAHR